MFGARWSRFGYEMKKERPDNVIRILIKAVFLYGLFGISAAHAQDVSSIVQNIGTSSYRLPGLVTAIAYASGLLLGVLAIFKLKDHVETPHQTPLREPLIRFLAGGALFALPIMYEAMKRSIDGGTAVGFSQQGMITGLLGTVSFATLNFNQILNNIVTSFSDAPALISGIGYLLALLLGVSGILKLREHVDSPQNVSLREPVIRFLVGGALFAMPAVFHALQETITGSCGMICGITTVLDQILGVLFGGTGMLTSGCSPTSLLMGLGGPIVGLIGSLFGLGSNPTVGDAICKAVMSSYALPAFLNACAYLFGIVLGLWGLMKLKDHVLSPHQVSIWEPTSRLMAAGLFFALPYVINVVRNTLGSGLGFAVASGFSGTPSTSGLDGLMARLMLDLYGPAQFAVNFFGYVGGIIFVMIGISRLLKGANEGPRAPGGLGTIMTFIIGGALISLSPMIQAVTSSLFTTGNQTNAVLNYTTGMTGAEVAHVQAVISAVLQFMIILGMISFARGLFILRAVSEGSSQASLMAGITHILGGALAINLGPVMNAVQATLNLTAYGVTFT
jgi:hypothetical protein